MNTHTHTHQSTCRILFFCCFYSFFFGGGGVLMVYYITVKVVVPACYDFPSVLTKQNSHSRVHTGADGRDGSYLHVHTVKCVVCLHQIREVHLLIHFEILCWTGWLSCKFAKAWIRTFWNECDTQKALVAVVEYNNNLKTKILNHCQRVKNKSGVFNRWTVLLTCYETSAFFKNSGNVEEKNPKTKISMAVVHNLLFTFFFKYSIGTIYGQTSLQMNL